MEEDMNYVTNVVLPSGETVYVKDEDALHSEEYAKIKANVNAIQQKVDELINKLSTMAYNIPSTDNVNNTSGVAGSDGIPDAKPNAIGNLNW